MILTPLILGQQSGAVARQATDPCPTISTAGAISCTTPIAAGGKIVAGTSVWTLAFVILKLTRQIDWNWFWVLWPVWWWIPAGIILIAAVLYALWEERKERNESR